jgi:hypothetical protein
MMPFFAHVPKRFLSSDGAAVGIATPTAKPVGSPLEVFTRVLDESSTALADGEGLQIPDDELHREILLPLLPAMLGDKAIRQHWREQAASGFLARLTAHLETDAPMPRWLPGDFEIHVTASYLAAPDAKALADTLLSEESLRDMVATLLNQVLGMVWPKLPVAAAEPPPVTTPVLVEKLPAAAVEAVLAAPAPLEVEAVAPAAPAAEEEVMEGEAFVSAAEPTDEPQETPAASEPLPKIEAPLVESEAASRAHERSPAWPSFLRARVPALRALQRATKPSPLRGIRHSFGGLGEPGWQSRNPLKRRAIG